MLTLKEALSVLDKSSPFAVSTESDLNNSELNEIKNHLYIETKIEKEFSIMLPLLDENDVLFLCGSSGDGKSELLTRYSERYKDKINFHLDATHSFEPQNTAIDTLNKLFTKHEDSGLPLVVGINVGMLGNFAEEGDERHEKIRNSIKGFLKSKPSVNKQYNFIDFESFPKFDLASDQHTSDFVQQLLFKVTEQSDKNPLYILYTNELKNGDSILSANYQLLSMSSVQSVIIELLLKARLVKDQFITARALLDFVYHILKGPGYIFDNLFQENDNELGAKIATFDPCAIRRKELDLFVLQQELKLTNADFNTFANDLSKLGIDYSNNYLNQYSLIRLFYLLKDESFSNDYHLNYKADFEDQLIEQYSKIWSLHADFNGDSKDRTILKNFYRDTVLLAINRYANRNANDLNKDEFYISSLNGWNLTVELELSVNYNEIKTKVNQRIAFFYAFIKVSDRELPPIAISISLLDLMTRIVHGYRPNKHDKNTVVLLDEIVEQIIDVANTSSTLYLHTDSNKIKIKQVDDTDIEVSGIS